MQLTIMTRLVLLSALGMLAACRNIEETKNPVSDSLVGIGATAPPELTSTSEELRRVQFDDVPVPDGLFFRNHRNESFSYTWPGGRIGRFVYWGNVNRDRVIAQFLEMMPKDPYKWALSSGPSQGGAMTFEKPGQKCEIRFTRARPSSQKGLLVTISVEST